MNKPVTNEVQTKGKISVWRLLGTLFSLSLLLYLIFSQGWDTFLQVLRQIPPWYFLIALAFGVGSRLAVTLRWYILLRAADAPFRFRTCLRLTFSGLFSSNFLPSTVGGDLVRLAGAIQYRLDAALSAASLVVDRLVGMAGMAFLLPIGLVTVAQSGIVLLLPATNGLLAASLIKLPVLNKLWDRLVKFIHSLISSSTLWLHKPSSLLLSLLSTFVHQICVYLVIWVLLRGMNENVPIYIIGGLWSLSYFFSLMPISINGFGLQEVSIAYLFTNFAGVSIQAGLALALLYRMLFMLISLPGAFFLPDILRPREPVQSGSDGASQAKL
jgi:glycosyltransferase 2 family protein